MSNEKTSKDIVESMARTLALYHAIFAREAIAAMGEEKGTALVRKVVSLFGEERGRRIREKVLSAGEEPTLDSMNAHYDLPLGCAWESEKFEDGSDITYCPMCDEWKKMDAVAEGKIYCGVDEALLRGFTDTMRFSRTATMMDGDTCCRHRYEKT